MCSTITSVMPAPWMRRTSSIAVRISVGVRPGHRLVEQQHLGLGGQRPGDLQPLAAGRAEAVGRRVGDEAEADALQHLARLGARVARVGMAQEGADHDVVEHRHGLERQRHLEGAGDAEPGARLRRQPRDVAPSKYTVPEVGGRSPVRQLKKVDLPAPLGPIRPSISPSSTATDASSTALKAPNALVTLRASSSMAARGLDFGAAGLAGGARTAPAGRSAGSGR